MKWYVFIALYWAFSVFSLSRSELRTQMASCLVRHSLDLASIAPDSSCGREFDFFSEKLHEIKDHALLQLKFVNLFFLRSVLVGLIEVRADFDTRVFEDTYRDVECAILETRRKARMRLMESRLDGEEKLDRVVDDLLGRLAIDVSGYKRAEEAKVLSYRAMEDEVGDTLSDLLKSVSSRSSGGSSGVAPVPRLRFRQCCACDAEEVRNVTRRVSGVLVGSARRLVKV